jgi:hypothetical protein
MLLQSPTGRQSVFALRDLVAQGQRLFDVVRATTFARLLFPPLFGWDLPLYGEHKRLNGILRKLTRSGFLPADFPTFDKHCSRADSTLFCSILLNPCHVLHDLLSPRMVTPYNTRPRPHDLTLPGIDALAKRSFIMRMLSDFA